MFNEKSEGKVAELVAELVTLEYENACTLKGKTYANTKKALEVLSEEIREVEDEVWICSDKTRDLRCSYILEGQDIDMDVIKVIEKRAICAVLEMAQVLAVLGKIQNGIGEA